MGYTPFKDLAAGIVAVLTGTGKFRQVLFTQATNGAQLWDKIESLAALPVAVVAMGESDYGDRGLRRTVRPMIFMVAPFHRGMEREAGGLWDLLETVEAAFHPDEEGEDGIFKTICGIELHLENSVPIESPEKVSACCLTLAGTEFMQESTADETTEEE